MIIMENNQLISFLGELEQFITNVQDKVMANHREEAIKLLNDLLAEVRTEKTNLENKNKDDNI